MAEVTEQDLRVFTDAVIQYFSRLTGEAAAVQTSYLADGELPELDCTGLITFSGRYRGCIYCSADRAMLRDLLISQREPDLGEHNLLDTIGEIANTIAGITRKQLGSGLEISVPVKLSGDFSRIRASVRARPFTILVTWRNRPMAVVVDLESVD